MPDTDVTIQYLELPSRGAFRGKRSPRPGVAFARVLSPMPELNRFFYAAIGGQWFWLERRPWTLAQWAEWTERADLETWVLSVVGIPAGYCELLQHTSGDVEIKYFGLLSAFVGS